MPRNLNESRVNTSATNAECIDVRVSRNLGSCLVSFHEAGDWIVSRAFCFCVMKRGRTEEENPLLVPAAASRAPRTRTLVRENSMPRVTPHDAMPSVVTERFGSVVLLQVSFVAPDYMRPWQMNRQGGCSGTGFAIDNRRILTNFHVVEHGTDIRIRKHGQSRRWPARVVCAAQDVDLAVVEIEEGQDEFWEGMTAIEWDSELPPLQSTVNVVGYPTGGETLCVTEGVVSRVDTSNYRCAQRGTALALPGEILVIQIDAAINGGNSGGPVFNRNGLVTGVAFQGLGGDAQNVGYVIPAMIAQNFLHDIKQNNNSYSYSGVQEMPFRYSRLQNASLRGLLSVPEGVTGVVVNAVSPLYTPEGMKENEAFLLKEDVITHIDGKAIGDDFTVLLRDNELVSADFLITGKRSGQKTEFSLLRAGRQMTIESQLKPLPGALPRTHGVDCQPEWLMVGGLLFVPLTCPLIDTDPDDLSDSGFGMLQVFSLRAMREFRKKLGSEVIVLLDILACDVNFGYDFSSWRVLKTLNGKSVENLAELNAIYQDCSRACLQHSENATTLCPQKFLNFKFEDESRIVLETEKCEACESIVLQQHGMPSAASEGVQERTKTIIAAQSK